MRMKDRRETQFRRPWWSRGRWYWKPKSRWLQLLPWNGIGCGSIALVIFFCMLAFVLVTCVPMWMQR